MNGPPASARAERLRVLLAPGIAFLSAALAMCCIVTMPEVVSSWPQLVSLHPGVVAWCALAGAIGLAALELSFLVSAVVGAAPLLTAGVMCSLAGLVLGHHVDATDQLVIALVCLGCGAGTLFAAGICMLDELPSRTLTATRVAWALPWASGWALVCWVELHDHRTGVASLGARPPGWLAGAVGLVILVWAVTTLALEPPRTNAPASTGWENAWAALNVLIASSMCLAMLIALWFTSPSTWARPVILLTASAAVAGLLGCCRLIPSTRIRPAFLALSLAMLTGPTSIQLLYLACWLPSRRPSVLAVVVVVVSAVVGATVGRRRPRAALSVGLAVIGLAAAGGWVLPSDPWLMTLAAAPLAAGLAAAVAASLRIAEADRMAVRYLVAGGLAAVLIGLVSAAPVAWSLGGAITGTGRPALTGGRILLGLTFALTAAGSAALHVLARQIDAPDADLPRAGRFPQNVWSEIDGR